MKVDLPDFKGQEKNMLYFVGNGFDLFHDLKTRYIDFHDWLIKYHYDENGKVKKHTEATEWWTLESH